MRKTICLILLAIACIIPQIIVAQETVLSCNVKVKLYDSYGDGWNGNVLSFYQNDTLVADITLTDGNSQEITLQLVSDSIRLYWTAGSWADECSFFIINEEDDTLFWMSGMSGISGAIGGFNNNCSSCPRPVNLRIIDRGADYLTIRWNYVSDVSWIVKYAEYNSNDMSTIITSSDTLRIDQLMPFSSYKISVQALCSEGDTSNERTSFFVTEIDSGGCNYVLRLSDPWYGDFRGGKVTIFKEDMTPVYIVTVPTGVWLENSRYDYTFKAIPSTLKFAYNQTTDISSSALSERTIEVLNADGLVVSSTNGDSAYNATLANGYFDSVDFKCPYCPSIIHGFYATALDSTTATVWWDNTGADQYHVRYFPKGGGDAATTTTSDTVITLHNLLPSTGYQVCVRAICGDSISLEQCTYFTTGPCKINRIYVSQNSTNDTIDGTSWSRAYHSISDALVSFAEQSSYYNNHPDIWVASGTYYGSYYQTHPQQYIYGGFAGNETELSERPNVMTSDNQTILDGQGDYQVIYQEYYYPGEEYKSVWDGFTVRNSILGAAIGSNAILRNCIFEGNAQGISVYNYAGTNEPQVVNCQIKYCQLRMFYGYNALVENTLFAENECNNSFIGSDGGLIFINCDIVNNTGRNTMLISSYSGASNDTLLNCIVWRNRTFEGQAVVPDNSITVMNTAMEGIANSNGNIQLSTDNWGNSTTSNYVNFVSPTEGNYRLNVGSACIDAAVAYPDMAFKDLYGNIRINGLALDMGCIESDGTMYCTPPQNIEVSNRNGDSVTICWTTSSVSSITLRYGTEGWTTVSGITGSSYTIGGLLENTVYQLQLLAQCNNGTILEWSDTIRFNSGCHYPTEPIMLPQDNSDYYTYSNRPLNASTPYSKSHILVKANELGSIARTIDTLGFYFNSDACNRNIIVTISPTNLNSLSWNTIYEYNSEIETVYSGTIHFRPGWTKIPLQQPFEYNGISNIVITITDTTGTVENYNKYFRCYYTEYTSTLYSYGNTLEELSYNNYSSYYRPFLYFSGGCDQAACHKPRLYTDMVTDTSVTLTLDRIEGNVTVEYKISNSDTYISYDEIDATDTNLVITGLIGGTNYDVRIRQVCLSGDTSEWVYVHFTTNPYHYNHIYVKADATGSNNGLTWEAAFNSLADALSMAEMHYNHYYTFPDIWVAAGVYYGDTAQYSGNAFTTVSGVNVYGGFVGNETSLSERPDVMTSNYKSILDGYGRQRVLYHSNNYYSYYSDTTLWDGFTIRNGYTNSSNGAGVYLNYNGILRNCIIENNRLYTEYNGYFGGGVFSNNGILEHCIIRNNTATGGSGGGVYASGGSIISCIITDDSAGISGGGLYLDGTLVENTLVYDCHSYYSSAGVYSNNINTRLIGCDIVNNTYYSTSTYPVGIQGQCQLINCIVWGNHGVNDGHRLQIGSDNIVTHCAIEGGYPGEGNINLEIQNTGSASNLYYPMFVQPEDFDFRLMEGSPMIDAGIDYTYSDSNDLGGNQRYYGDSVDIGCYENHNESFCSRPTSIQIQTASTAALFTWQPSPNAEYVEIEYRQSDGEMWSVLSNITENHYMLDGLVPSQNYSLRMRSYCNTGLYSPYSPTINFTTHSTSSEVISYTPDSAYRTSIGAGGYVYWGIKIPAERLSAGSSLSNVGLYVRENGTYSMTIYEGGESLPQSPLFTESYTFNDGEGWHDCTPAGPISVDNTKPLWIIFHNSGINYPAASTSYMGDTNSDWCSTNGTSWSHLIEYGLNYSWLIYTEFAHSSDNTCPTPLIVVNNITDSSAVLFCQTSLGQGVEIQYKPSSSEDFITLTVVQEQTLTGLQNNTTYQVRVRTICENGLTTDWHTISFKTALRQQNLYYVKPTASGSGDGSSWDNATTLTEALESAAANYNTFNIPVDVWVAAGTYYGNYYMYRGVNVYGGFEGNESEFSERPEMPNSNNPSIIDAENSGRVLYQSTNFNNGNTAVWDGFILQNGNLSDYGAGAYIRSGGILRNSIIRNCISTSGYGGGIYSTSGYIENITVDSCSARYYGGGIYSTNSTIKGCTIKNCTADYSNWGYSGGGIYSSNDTIIGCQLINNTAPYNGAMYAYSSYIANCLIHNNKSRSSCAAGLYYTNFINNTVVNNTTYSSNTCGIYMEGGTMSNSVIWGNRSTASQSTQINTYDNLSITHCAIEGGLENTENINLASDNYGTVNGLLYPRFANPEDGDFRITLESPLINAGINESNNQQYDLSGNRRVYGDTIDIGCYENNGEVICVRPISINVVSGWNAAMITWSKIISAESTELHYRIIGESQWNTIDSITSQIYTLTTLLPETTYEIAVRSYCGTDGNYSPWSDITTFTTGCPLDIHIDDTTSNNDSYVCPFYSYYPYSFSQQIYLRDELGKPASIKGISLKYYGHDTLSRNLKIYLGHTSKSSFSSVNDALNRNTLTLVFDGSAEFNAYDEWQTIDIPFQTIFEYNGIDNLVMVVLDSSGWYSSEIFFSSEYKYTSRALFSYSDHYIYDATSSNYGLNINSVINKIAFIVVCDSNECSSPLITVTDITSNSARLLCQTGVGSSTELQYKKSNETEWTALTTFDEVELINLAQNTIYTARIRTHCGSDTLEWRRINFKTRPLMTDVIYVASESSGLGDGTSWENATSDLSWAVSTADAINNLYHQAPSVWVASGTYYGHFNMLPSINVYGGFAGNESSLNARQLNVATSMTILDAQHSGYVLQQESSFSTENAAQWDGFILQNGTTSSNEYCIFLRYNGTLSNSVIRDCYANNTVVYIDGGTVDNCIITNDSSKNGCVIYMGEGNLTNSLINNNVTNCNTIIHISYGLFSNNTIVNNLCRNSSTSYVIYSYSTVYNSIIWGNRNSDPSVLFKQSPSGYNSDYYENCAIEGEITNSSYFDNISLDESNTGTAFSPKFIQPTTFVGMSSHMSTVSLGDWHLSDGSVCANRGNNSFCRLTTDLDGTNRIKNDTVDIGCYESPYFSSPLPQYDSIIYVKPIAEGIGDGTSWANAMNDINRAQQIAATIGIKSVWVAGGTYYGGFVMCSGVNVYGGFAGNESSIAERPDVMTSDNPSILDGSNMQRVLTQQTNFSQTTAVEWNGFTIRNGYMSSGSGGGASIGLYAKLTQCVITNNYANYGGGVNINGGTYSEYYDGEYRTLYCSGLENCKIFGNISKYNGGGVNAFKALMSNVLINDNKSEQGYGAGLYIAGTYVINSTIASNTCIGSYSGAGINGYYYNSYTTNTIRNSIVWGNKRGYYVDNCSGSYTNYYNCAIEETDGLINLASQNDGSDPTRFYVRFSDPTVGDYTLHPSSSCIDLGDSITDNYLIPTLDLAGNSRLIGNIDLGCYESHYNNNCPSPISATAINITESSASIRWTPGGSEAQWAIRYVSNIDTTVIVSDTTYALSGLHLNRTYRVYVRAICDSGAMSIWSIPAVFTTDCDASQLSPLSPFTTLMPANGTSVYSQWVDFAWNSIPEATSYDLYLWRDGDAIPTTPTRTHLTTSFSDHIQIPNYEANRGVTFHWYVVAWNECISLNSDTFDIQVPHLPNLHVSGFTIGSAVSNQTVNIEWTVVNDGLGSTPPGTTWSDYIWISSIPEIGSGYETADEVLLAAVPNLQSLAPGESYTNSTTIAIPRDYEGGKYFFVMTDQYSAYEIDFSSTGSETLPLPYEPSNTGYPYNYLMSLGYGWYYNNSLKETLENDNFFYKNVIVLPPPTPDLLVSSITHPLNAFSDDSITITWLTVNNGDAATVTSSWSDAVYISSNPTFNFSTSTLLGTFEHTGSLAIGQTYTGNIRGQIPAPLNGTYYIYVVTDINDDVYENIYEANNATVSEQTINIVMSAPPDLEVDSIGMIPDTLSTNESITLSYKVTNVGSKAVTGVRWYDAVYLSPTEAFSPTTARRIGYASQYRTLGIGESYIGTIRIIVPDSISDYQYLFVKTDINDNVFEYTYEDNNLMMIPEAIYVALPDLQIAWIEAPTTINANQPFTIRWCIKNAGPGKLYKRDLRSNITKNGHYIYSGYVFQTTLDNNDSIVQTATVMVGCATENDVRLAVTADNEGIIFESNENNNTVLSGPIGFSAPDLASSNLTTSGSMMSGKSATFSWTLTNSGTAAVDQPITDQFYFASSNGLSGGTLIREYTRHITLAPGESIIENVTATLPNGISGNLRLHQIVNADDNVCEGANLASNHIYTNAKTVELSPYADLIVTDMLTATNYNLGETFMLDYTIRNQGNGALANDNITTKFYITRYSTLSTSNATLIGTDVKRISIDVNQDVTLSTLLRIPSNLSSGNYYIFAHVDAPDSIYEYTGENNNTTHSDRVILNVYQLDITAAALKGSQEVQWGGTYSYTLTVTNNSQMPSLAHSWIDRLYLSSDDVLQSSDLQLASINHYNGLEASESYNATFSITIPMGTPYNGYIIAVVDANNANPDLNMNNNILVTPIVVSSIPTADLAVSDIEVIDRPIVSGQYSRVAYTVTNISNTAVNNSSWTDKIYLSSNSIYESDDVEIGSTSKLNMSLEPGASYTDTASFRIPLPQNGTLYLIVRANSNNNFYEVNTANNVLSISTNVTLPQPGDLVVEDIVGDDSAYSGQYLHLQWSVMNTGDNTLSGSNLRSLAYISTDKIFDAGDRMLGSVINNNIMLPPGAELRQLLTSRISGLPEGNYYIIVKTDVSNAFNEINDTNNTGVSDFPIVVSVRNLPFNTPVSDTLKNNQPDDFKLNIGDNIGETVHIHVDADDVTSGAVNMIYVSYNNIGSDLNYTYSSIGQFTTSPELYIPSTESGYYGINVVGSTPTDSVQTITVQADLLPFELRGVNPTEGGNSGNVTVELTGSRFRPDMKVWLSRDSTRISPDTVIYDSYYRAFATFNMKGMDTGWYSAGVLNYCEGEAVLNHAFHVIPGTPENLSTNLIMPAAPRPNRTVVMLLEFGNIGTTDIESAVVEIESLGGAHIALTNEGLTDHNTIIRVPLKIDGDVSHLIRPGATGMIPVYCITDGAMVFSIKRVR